MSREIDERIVAMYFDNKNFESGAQQTLKTLDELKKSMSFDGVGKGFEAFEQASKKLNLDKMSQSARKLKDTFSGVGSALTKSLKTVMSPLDNLKRSFREFNGIVTKVAGINIASKLVSGIEQTFRSLTIAPISAGWNQYENTMDSVKTIMSSTGETIDVVKEKLNHMTNYANQTIYSLNDMTSNLGKFTNNGVKLDDATQAMIGLANATADAGQGAAQASMAMYNVSQAIGVGKMTAIDWKSLENANIATTKLKQTFIDAAVATGDLEKKMVKNKETGEEVVEYWTKAEKGAKAEQVTTEKFRDTLSKGWLTKEAMLNTFAIYSGELDWKDILQMGYTEEQAKQLAQIGKEAMEAATQVRTFKKMMDALKEGVQSTWATSFEYIFGDMEEGTALWTKLNEKVESVLEKSAKNRNDILLSWRGLMRDEDGNIRKVEEVYKRKQRDLIRDLESGYINYEAFEKMKKNLDETLGDTSKWVDYREIMIDAIIGNGGLFDVLQNLAGTVSGAWEDVFGKFNADSLKQITQGFADLVKGVGEWLGSADDADSRLSKLRKGLSGVFSVLKVGRNILKAALTVGWNTIKPIIDPLLNLFAKFGDLVNLKGISNLGDMLKVLGERFKGLWDKLSKLGWKGIFDKIGTWMSDLWSTIKTGISTALSDFGLDGIVQWFVDIGDKIKEGWKTIENWWNKDGNVVRETFSKIWDAVSGLFKSESEGEDIPIVKFFKNIYGWITSAWDAAYSELSKWWNGGDNGLANFFKGIWDTVSGIFKPDEETGTVPIVDFFLGIYDAVTNAWNTVSTKLTEWWNNGENEIAKFFKDIWKAVSGIFKPDEETGAVPIVDFFLGIYDWITNAWNTVSTKLTEWWNGGDNGLAKFFKGIWDAVSGIFKPSDETGTIPIVDFFLGIYDAVTNAWNTVSGKLTEWWNNGENEIAVFFKGIWDSVSGIFKAEDGKKAPIVEFFESLPGAIKTAWDNMVDWIKSVDSALGISKFFTDAWGWLMEKLNIPGQSDTSSSQKTGNALRYDPSTLMALNATSDTKSPVRSVVKSITGTSTEIPDDMKKVPVIDFLLRIKDTLAQVWDDVTGWPGWAEIGQFFSDVWTGITAMFQKSEAVPDDTGNLEEKKSAIASIGEFFRGIFESLSEAVQNIGTSAEAKAVMDTIVEIVRTIVTAIGNIADWLSRLVTGTDKNGKKMDVLTDAVGPLLWGVLGIILQVLSVKKAGSLATISEAGGIMTNIGGQVLELAAGIALISVAVKFLGSLPIEQLALGAGAIAVIGVVLTFLFSQLSQFSSTLTHADPQKAWERVVGKLISTAGMVGMLWILLDKLPAIIDAMSEAKKYSGLNGDDLLKTLEGLLLTVAGMALSLGVIEKIVPAGLNPVAALKTVATVMGSLALVGAVLLGTGGLLELLGADPQAILDKMRIVAAFLEGLGDSINALFRGLTGVSHGEELQEQTAERNMEHTKELMGYLSEISDKFDSNKLTSISLMMSTITDLSKMAENVDSSGLVNFTSTMDYLTSGLLKFSELFTGKYEFVEDGAGGYTTQYLEGFAERGTEKWNQLMDAYELIQGFLGSLTPLSGIANQGVLSWFEDNIVKGNGVDVFVEGMNKIIDSAGNLHDASGIEFDGALIVSNFYKAISDAFAVGNGEDNLYKIDGMPIVNAILDSLLVGEYAIKEAVRAMVQAGIDLLGTSTGTPEGLDFSGLMGSLNFGDFFSFDVSDAFSQEQLGGVISETMDALGTQTEGAVKDMKKSLVNVKVGGISFDENFMANLQTQMEDLQKTLDEGGEEYTLQIRPILNTTGFDAEVAKLQAFFTGDSLLSMNATVNLGEQLLPIDDEALVTALKDIRGEIKNHETAIESSIRSLETSLGNRITSLGYSVAKMKFVLDTGALAAALTPFVDKGLNDGANTSGLTGTNYSRPPVKIDYNINTPSGYSYVTGP